MSHLPRATFALPALLAALLLLGGCSYVSSFFGSEADAKAKGANEVKEAKVEEPKDPFEEGVLKAVAHFAPSGSTTQYLARIAEQYGWEKAVARNTLLRNAVVEKKFDEKVEPYLLSLFFSKGFSVLPTVGEGHQFARDTIVRGGVADSRFLVTTRERVRIIFLTPLRNVLIIFPQDGTQPQLFTPKNGGVVAVRRSLLKQYLR